jgi:hypothetical protein
MAAPRPAKDLKPTDERAKLLKKMQQDKTKRLAGEMRKKAREQASDKKVQPAKDVDHRRTKTSSRAEFLREAKKGNIRTAKSPAADLKPGDMRSQTLNKGKPQPAADLKSGDARSKFLKGAQDGSIKAAKGSSLGRALVKKIPVLGTAAGFIADASPLNAGEEEFLATVKRKAGKGYGAAPVGPFKPKAGTKVAGRREYPGSNTGNRALRSASGTYTESYEPKRKASGTYTASYDVKAKSETPKPERKATATASDKSRLAPKMTAFQRQQARQFEKEGVAGRSMTAAQAKRKASEKGSSVAGLRSLFGLSKVKSAPDKKSLSSEFRKKNLAANQKIGKKQ